MLYREGWMSLEWNVLMGIDIEESIGTGYSIGSLILIINPCSAFLFSISCVTIREL